MTIKFGKYKNDAKKLKTDWSPDKWVLMWEYQRELSNEYQHDRVLMVFENLCVLVLKT